jgi:hypothetical protein
MPPNFQNGKIYSIRSHQTEKIYVGSTTQPLYKRFHQHKKPSNKTNSKEIMKFADAYIELIENYPCIDKDELHMREGEIIRERDCVNRNIAGRTKAEWREDNKENIKEINKQYREEHKEEIKQYRQDNKETRNQYSKQYRQEHTEETKQYREEHKEEAKQYYEGNKESISAYGKQYHQTHKESIATRVKQYQQTHKKIRKCSCGVEYNDGKTDCRNQHYGSNHHIEFVNDFYERLHQLLVDNLIIPDF